MERLEYGLHNSYIDKNEHIKRNVAVELESLSIILDDDIGLSSKENFDEYLRAWTNIYNDNDHFQIFYQFK